MGGEEKSEYENKGERAGGREGEMLASLSCHRNTQRTAGGGGVVQAQRETACMHREPTYVRGVTVKRRLGPSTKKYATQESNPFTFYANFPDTET